MEPGLTDFDIASRLGDVARRILTPYGAARDGTAFRSKEDGSPVTEADVACERALREMLAELAPNDAIMGEELERKDGSARCWVLDPIDGTKAFASGSPLFCTLAGLVEDSSFIAGLIEFPMLRMRWVAGAGRGVFCGPEGEERDLAGATSTRTDLSAASLAVTAPLVHPKWDRLRSAAAFVRYGGDAFNFASVATGRLDIALDEGLQPHDFTALLPILEHAGACYSDFSGAKPMPGQPTDLLVAANADLHQQVLDILNA